MGARGAAAISLEGIGHRFGTVHALEGVTLEVPRGCLFGLVGRNGAGKTTLLHVALGLLSPDRGRVRVFGVAASRVASLSGRVGAVTHRLGLEASLTAGENLRLHALRHGRRGVDPSPILRRLALEGRAGARVARLSQGERQRLALARALLLAPDLLVLDEPLANLDPAAAHRAMAVLREEVRARGASVLLSSHQLRHVEQGCDRLALLHEGRVEQEGTLEDLLASSPRRLLVRAAPHDEALRVLRAHPLVRHAEASPDRPAAPLGGGEEGEFSWTIAARLRDPTPEVVGEALHRAGIRIRHLGMEPLSLEDLFREGHAGEEPAPGARS